MASGVVVVCLMNIMRGKYETDNILYCNTIDYNTTNNEALIDTDEGCTQQHSQAINLDRL